MCASVCATCIWQVCVQSCVLPRVCSMNRLVTSRSWVNSAVRERAANTCATGYARRLALCSALSGQCVCGSECLLIDQRGVLGCVLTAAAVRGIA
jgi:hypothetical protein